MISVRGQGRLAQRGQASEALTNRFNNGNYKDPLGSNKPGPSEAPTGPEAPAGPPQAPLPVALDIARYT